jgi:hypothetical protein
MNEKNSFEHLIDTGLCLFSFAPDGVVLVFNCGELSILNLTTMWRIVHEGKIVSSVMDHFVCLHDIDGLDYWTMELEEPKTHDYDEYREELFEKLASHSNCAIQKCKQLLEGETVVSVDTGSFEDVKITFSNGAVLECFTICSDKDVPSITLQCH